MLHAQSADQLPNGDKFNHPTLADPSDVFIFAVLVLGVGFVAVGL